MKTPVCKYFQFCGLYADEDPESELCILHSENIDKNPQTFSEALNNLYEEKGYEFQFVVFPYTVDYKGVTFKEKTDFMGAKFLKGAYFTRSKFVDCRAHFGLSKFRGGDFFKAEFNLGADFSFAEFNEGHANFTNAQFNENTNFISSKFGEKGGKAIFKGAVFKKTADFQSTVFDERALFINTIFEDSVDFRNASFSKNAQFREAQIRKTAYFSGKHETSKTRPIFLNCEIDFSSLNMDSQEASLIIRDADLRMCRFIKTDIDKVKFSNVTWPRMPIRVGTERFVLYDEILTLKQERKVDIPHVEELYLDLKKKYEVRGRNDVAGDFHYGAKEMARRNSDTPLIHRILLVFYCLSSGYGERYMRPLICALFLLFLCTIMYLFFGISDSQIGKHIHLVPHSTETLTLKKSCVEEVLTIKDWRNWLKVAQYSLETMLLLKPESLRPSTLFTQIIHTLQSILGPLFFTLFALAVRQRLKR